MRYVWDGEHWVPATSRKRGLDRVIVAGVGGKAGWPIKSLGAAVLPSQLDEAREQMAQAGVRCDFTQEGEPVFENSRHRRECLKAMGLHDRSSFC